MLREARGPRQFAEAERADAASVSSLVFEDQDGARITFGELFTGLPSIVAFFYTRCENPRKCSLTVAKLGRVQQLLAAAGAERQVRIAAITYDPQFDTPERLKAYAAARGLRPNAGHRLLRTAGDIQALRDHFALGVNFVHSLVNRHRIELYVLDLQARVAASFLRLEWDEQRVVDEALALLRRGACGCGH
jgi:protein SCO1/2